MLILFSKRNKMLSSSRTWLLILLALLAVNSFEVGKNYFHLRLLHVNDMHARLEQVSQTTGKCSDYEANNNLCFGGFARISWILTNELNKAKEENVSILSLNAGDNFQGSVWYSLYKWKVIANFFKYMKVDAMALGNHEFDDGVQGFTPFLHSVKVPILSCNIDFLDEPELNETLIKPYIILEKEGRKIGIVGYLTPDTVVLADAGKLKFENEIESLSVKCKELQQKGVNIIIALGHSGYEVDLEIAAKVPDVDVVVGGHSHTFLYSGTPPDIDVPINSYPVIINQSSGRKVAMVQAYAYTKYLGKLDLKFDEKGELLEAWGNPILLDYKIQQDESVLTELQQWQDQLNETMKEKLGITKIFLNGYDCRFYECNLGNLITDAYIHYAVSNYNGPLWSRAAIAIQQGGGIRASINATGSNGIITKEDVITSMPFFTPLCIVQIKGKDLLAAMEWSVARYDTKHQIGRGEFLQVSGIKIKYDLNRPPGSKVTFLQVRCNQCIIPKYENLDLKKEYNIIMPRFLFTGGDNYTMFKEKGMEIYRFDLTDTEVAMHYIKTVKTIYSGLEGRIEFIEGKTSTGSLTSKLNIFYLYITISLFIFKYKYF